MNSGLKSAWSSFISTLISPGFNFMSALQRTFLWICLVSVYTPERGSWEPSSLTHSLWRPAHGLHPGLLRGQLFVPVSREKSGWRGTGLLNPVLQSCCSSSHLQMSVPWGRGVTAFSWLLLLFSKTTFGFANGVGGSEKEQESSKTRTGPVSPGRQLRMSYSFFF